MLRTKEICKQATKLGIKYFLVLIRTLLHLLFNLVNFLLSCTDRSGKLSIILTSESNQMSQHFEYSGHEIDHSFRPISAIEASNLFIKVRVLFVNKLHWLIRVHYEDSFQDYFLIGLEKSTIFLILKEHITYKHIVILLFLTQKTGLLFNT